MFLAGRGVGSPDVDVCADVSQTLTHYRSHLHLHPPASVPLSVLPSTRTPLFEGVADLTKRLPLPPFSSLSHEQASPRVISPVWSQDMAIFPFPIRTLLPDPCRPFFLPLSPLLLPAAFPPSLLGPVLPSALAHSPSTSEYQPSHRHGFLLHQPLFRRRHVLHPCSCRPLPAAVVPLGRSCQPGTLELEHELDLSPQNQRCLHLLFVFLPS